VIFDVLNANRLLNGVILVGVSQGGELFSKKRAILFYLRSDLSL